MCLYHKIQKMFIKVVYMSKYASMWLSAESFVHFLGNQNIISECFYLNSPLSKYVMPNMQMFIVHSLIMSCYYELKKK